MSELKTYIVFLNARVDKLLTDIPSDRYAELKLLEKVGEIRDLELQPRFRLVDGFNKNGKVFRPIDYIADFKYVDREGKTIVEDVKGERDGSVQMKKGTELLMQGANPCPHNDY